jgi:hypothetical protein
MVVTRRRWRGGDSLPMSYQSMLDNARVTWANVRGDWGNSADGKPLPIILVGDSVVMLSFVTDELARYIREYNQTGEDIHLEGLSGFAYPPISVSDYLGHAVPTPGRTPEYRSLTRNVPNIGKSTYGPYYPNLKWSGAYGLIQVWQNCIDLVASMLANHSPIEKLDKGSVDTLFSFIDDFAFLLDKNNELPSSTWGEIGAAAKAEAQWAGATTKEGIKGAAGLAGDALAEAADTVGQAGGKFLQSFLSTAGLTALAVTAAAIYIAMKV